VVYALFGDEAPSAILEMTCPYQICLKGKEGTGEGKPSVLHRRKVYKTSQCWHLLTSIYIKKKKIICNRTTMKMKQGVQLKISLMNQGAQLNLILS
jgi:hypothetical protein